MSRKGENIFKRKDGRWEARYIHHYEDGKAKYRSVYAPTYAEARALKVTRQALPESIRTPPVVQTCTFQDLADLWLAEVQPSVKESTYTRYHRIVERYLYPHFQKQVITKIDPRALGALPGDLLDRGGVDGGPLAPKTVSDILCVLKAIFRFGRQRGFPAPATEIVRSPGRAVRPVRILTQEHRERLERELIGRDDPTELGIVFTLFTGVRIGELCGLKWEDIDFGAGTVSIRRTVERIPNLDPDSGRRTKVVVSEPKTDSGLRVIPLPGFLTGYLRTIRKNPNSYLLTGNATHTEPHQYYIRYRKYLKRNDLGDYTFHALRHTFATRCVEAGFDPKALSEILGHADVATTLSIYVHPTLDQKKAQMERLTPDHIRAE